MRNKEGGGEVENDKGLTINFSQQFITEISHAALEYCSLIYLSGTVQTTYIFPGAQNRLIRTAIIFLYNFHFRQTQIIRGLQYLTFRRQNIAL